MSEWNQERIDLVKRTICPKGISNDEFALFIEQCKRSGLDPLVKEAFCVPRNKNVGNKASPQWVTIHEFQPSEAGMLVRAERFPDFRGIAASAVYMDDAISIDAGAGTVSHVFHPTKKRGVLIGAWCRLLREGKISIVIWLDLAAYAQNTSTWTKMPATMMEKCARVAALRKAYPAAFGGLYIKEEMPEEEFQATPAQIEAAPAVSTTARALPVTAVTPEASAILPPIAGRRTTELKQQLASKKVAEPAARKMPPIVSDNGPPEPPPPGDADAPWMKT